MSILAMKGCPECGAAVFRGLRGRRRRYCSDRCRHAAHKQRRRSGRAVTRARRAADQQTASTAPTAAPPVGGMAAWAAWARGTYVIDETGEQLLRLAVEADVRYQQARAVLDAEGVTMPDGRVRPEVAVERDARAAIARLIAQLDLEDTDETNETPADSDYRPSPRRVG